MKNIIMHKKSKWLVQHRDGTVQTSNFAEKPKPCLKTGRWVSGCFSWSYCNFGKYSNDWVRSLIKVIDQP